MKKFIATQGDLTAELSNNTIFIEGSYILNGDIHNLRVWLDRLDDELNGNNVIKTVRVIREGYSSVPGYAEIITDSNIGIRNELESFLSLERIRTITFETIGIIKK
jgi:hypothetical protein